MVALPTVSLKLFIVTVVPLKVTLPTGVPGLAGLKVLVGLRYKVPFARKLVIFCEEAVKLNELNVMLPPDTEILKPI